MGLSPAPPAQGKEQSITSACSSLFVLRSNVTINKKVSRCNLR